LSARRRPRRRRSRPRPTPPVVGWTGQGIVQQQQQQRGHRSGEQARPTRPMAHAVWWRSAEARVGRSAAERQVHDSFISRRKLVLRPPCVTSKLLAKAAATGRRVRVEHTHAHANARRLVARSNICGNNHRRCGLTGRGRPLLDLFLFFSFSLELSGYPPNKRLHIDRCS
jgi:hypothetical protein